MKITIERETLLPCPFCGAEAEILTIPADHPDAGGMFVQCCDSRCMTSSALLYPLMDDVRTLLVERWNRRAALAQPAPAAVPLTDEKIERLREATFSTNNPYCPVDSRSMRKAVRAAERAHGIGTAPKGE